MSKQEPLTESFMTERFDLRRFLLLAGKKLWWVIVGAMLGALLFGGGYYLKKNVFAGSPQYRSDALYQITFTKEEQDVTQLYYNDYTWNDVLDSDEVAGVAERMAGGISKAQIAAATRVPTMSDIRLFHVYVEDGDPETAERIQNAISVALSTFPNRVEGFEEIVQWDRKPAELLTEKNLINRWSIAGGILGALVALLAVACVYVMDDTVRLEKDLYRIPGMRERIAGSIFSGKTPEGEREHIAARLLQLCGESVCAEMLGGKKPAEDVMEFLEKALPETSHLCETKPSTVVCCIPAGEMSVAQVERLWNALEKEGWPEAVILTEVSGTLHKAYYLGKKNL